MVAKAARRMRCVCEIVFLAILHSLFSARVCFVGTPYLSNLDRSQWLAFG